LKGVIRVEGVVDVVVVGGGIIGCSIAMELAARRGFDEVILLEKGPFLGDGTSTRNSYVIHAGIYYPQGSLKARFCVPGNRELYAFCERHEIPCLNTGKVVLAFSRQELAILGRLLRQGELNGVEGLRILDERGLREREPSIQAAGALHVPSTGVFDVAQWFRVVEGVLYEQGAMVLKKTPVVGLEPKGEGIQVETATRGKVLARFLVNAAGLYADQVGNLLGNGFRIYPVRGDYFAVAGKRANLVRGAVYPPPGDLGLGIHLTRLWDGSLLVGPDARRVESKEDYGPLPVFDREGDLDEKSPDFRRFFDPVRKYFPAVQEQDLHLAHCGIRPSLLAPGEEGFRDFRIEWDRNDPRVIHLLGIDSPGLTASPAIARHVVDLLTERAS
jgi:L-2-hydroxyglutarate oxidase LhgO